VRIGVWQSCQEASLVTSPSLRSSLSFSLLIHTSLAFAFLPFREALGAFKLLDEVR